jgi:hypothetical protein
MRETMRLPIIRRLLLLALCAAAPVNAQVYKWTDDKGVVNYSNTPPADAKGKKGVSVVEDRVSVYSADPALVQATQNARDRRGQPPPSAPVDRRPAAAPPPPVAAADPCLNGNDPACYGGIYDNSGVFAGRRRPPHLVQPQLPVGATAGNVNAGTGFTPGLSTQAPLGAQPPVVQRPAPQSARMRDRDSR